MTTFVSQFVDIAFASRRVRPARVVRARIYRSRVITATARMELWVKGWRLLTQHFEYCGRRQLSSFTLHPPAHNTAIPATMLALVAYVPLLLWLLPFIPKPSLCNHVICSWQIGKEVPSRYQFKLFCPANIYDNTSDYAQYRCPDHWEPKGGVQVADWGKLALNILEWGEYCAVRSRGQLRLSSQHLVGKVHLAPEAATNAM